MAEEQDLGDDLYGDLEDQTAKSTSTFAKASSSTAMAAKAPPPSFKTPPSYPSTPVQQSELEEKVKALEAENLTLKRNMGMLYRTARREIERKDKQIAELMAELDKKKSGS